MVGFNFSPDLVAAGFQQSGIYESRLFRRSHKDILFETFHRLPRERPSERKQEIINSSPKCIFLVDAIAGHGENRRVGLRSIFALDLGSEKRISHRFGVRKLYSPSRQ